ncbi:hypothetical protein OG280_00825 [Streptomyces virginiae]|uniref:hypothetical protein n=1 Tax=Streptomyces virginiae TaxID=1961 RepID=UPI002DDAF872|nr:hypothetical protein [Streptomyces virginiae]WSC82014.1 hypothetical protein OHA56_39970 [Streptomyces virginiae]
MERTTEALRAFRRHGDYRNAVVQAAMFAAKCDTHRTSGGQLTSLAGCPMTWQVTDTGHSMQRRERTHQSGDSGVHPGCCHLEDPPGRGWHLLQNLASACVNAST